MISYFSNSTVSLAWGGGKEVSRKTSRGCPEGRVLGPSCWNIVFDFLLVNLERIIGKMIMAYANDLSALIYGNTREALEKKGKIVVNLIKCRSTGLQLSESKTAIMRGKYIPRTLKPFSQLASMRNE